MARRDKFASRGLLLRTVFCLLVFSLGFSGRASGATFTVTNTNDSGSGSLRQAITDANANAGSTVSITATGTITLLSTLPAITADMTISGPGANLLTVSGGNSATVGTIFTIDTGITVSISGLTIANSNSNADGGGILSNGTLTVSNCAFTNNSANNGGGIYNNGTMTVSNSTFSGNSASVDGAGIANAGTLTVTNSTFSANTCKSGGGAGILTQGTSLTVTNTTFDGNSSATSGAALANIGGTMTVANSILTADTPGGECFGNGCPTNGSGGNVVGVAANLAPLANYGGPTQTMLPQPGSPAICAGSANALTTDQRGFPVAHAVGGSTYCASGKIDSGAVQTNYTAVQFTNTNSGIGGYAAYVSNSASLFPAAPIVTVTEGGLDQGGVPLTLTFDGMGTATGLGPVTTVAGTGASFTAVSVNEAGSDTLEATLTVGTATLNASANLKIVSITLTPPAGTLPNAAVGEAYTETFTASGGSSSTYTYLPTVTSGTIPTGLTFNAATATLSGTPTATGTVGFTVKATDSNGFSGTQSYTLTANPALTATTSVPATTLTQNHAATPFTPVTASGGTTPLTYSVLPALPAGLSLNTSNGQISGTPTATSPTTTYTVTVTDRNSVSASSSFALTVNAAVTATTSVASTALTQNQIAVPFTPVTGSGGTPPLAYSVLPALPAGLTLNSTNGQISGTPTAASPATIYTVTVTDNNHATATAMFSLTVNTAVTATTAIATTVLTANHAPTPFTPVTGGGGTAPLTYSVLPALPTGLAINASNGLISGTPSTASAATTYTVTVTDSNHATATAMFSLTVNSAVTATTAIATTVLTANHAPTPFTPVTGAGGTTPLAYSVAPNLPAGLTLNSSNGQISGTPTTASTALSYTVTVTDHNGATATASFSLTVNTAVAATTAIPTTMLTVSQTAVTFTPVTGSGGTAPLKYSVLPGLPTGLTLNTSTGAISATPTAASPATNYTVTVTDTNGATATAIFSLTVNAAVTATLAIPAETLMVNQVASFMPVTGSNGTAPLRYSITPSLPSGLTLNPSTGAITGTHSAILPVTTFTETVADANQVMAQANFTLTVTPATTSVAVASSSTGNATVVDTTVTFTAQVTPFSGTTPIPPPYPGSAAPLTGSVTFTDNGTPICTSPVSVVAVNGSSLYEATCSTSALQAATSPHTILATYNGSTDYNTSNSSVTQTVTPATTSTTLASSLNPSVIANPKNVTDTVALTAKVTPFSGAVLLSGKVSYTDGGIPIAGCTAVSITPSTGAATCMTAFTSGGQHAITATYGSDLNYTGSSNPMPVVQSVQDFSVALPASGQLTVTQTFTNTTDPISPQPFNVTVTPIQGFATATGAPLNVTCEFIALGAPANAVAPNCPAATLVVSPAAGAQLTLPMTIDAKTATPGSYSLVVSAVDPTTGLNRLSPLKFVVNVSSITTTPITLASGSTTSTTVNFTLPAGLTLSLNCDFATISPSTTPVPTSSIPISCAASPATIGSAGSTAVQGIPVTVNINTGGNVSQLATKSDAFLAGLLGVPVLALIGFATRSRRRGRTFLRFLSTIFILGMVLQNIGCGGSFNRTTTVTNTTPAGVYYLIVQGPGTANTKQPYQAIIQVNVIR